MKTVIIIRKQIFLPIIFISLIGCSKPTPDNNGNGGNGNNNGNGNGNGNGNTTTPPVDPPVANTIGFFLNDWSSRSFTIPSYTDTTLPATTATTSISIDASKIITKVPTTVFGQNANSWMTQIVTQNSLMTHLENLHPGIMRFPGGSISDTYFWNQTTAAPADAPASLLDADGNTISNPY
ncbi:MAG TPA: hypothetical protein VGI82_09115, partial [Chitinophagaceae bacterium]